MANTTISLCSELTRLINTIGCTAERRKWPHEQICLTVTLIVNANNLKLLEIISLSFHNKIQNFSKLSNG